MRLLRYILLITFCYSCVTDDSADLILNDETTLLEDLEGKVFVTDAVIACAANDVADEDLLNVYFYPEEGATNFKFYETSISNVDPNNFANYTVLDIEDVPFFDGTLRQFNRRFSQEEWIIVAYEIDNRIKLSTPIRTKNVFQPTLWTDEIVVNQDDPGMPFFDWDVESYDNNAIFFEVVSTSSNMVLSGTYTNESEFKYYDLENVVLNITQGIPSDLLSGESYNITIMDVSIDNWVNTIIQKSFVAE